MITHNTISQTATLCSGCTASNVSCTSADKIVNANILCYLGSI